MQASHIKAEEVPPNRNEERAQVENREVYGKSAAVRQTKRKRNWDQSSMTRLRKGQENPTGRERAPSQTSLNFSGASKNKKRSTSVDLHRNPKSGGVGSNLRRPLQGRKGADLHDLPKKYRSSSVKWRKHSKVWGVTRLVLPEH